MHVCRFLNFTKQSKQKYQIREALFNKNSDHHLLFPSTFLQAQLVVLSTQIDWSENVETALTTIAGSDNMAPLQSVLINVEATLNLLADTVLMEQPPIRRKKLEHLVGMFEVLHFFPLHNSNVLFLGNAKSCNAHCYKAAS